MEQGSSASCRQFQSEHKQQSSKPCIVKFKPLRKLRHNSIESNLSYIDYSEDKRQFNNLSRKLAEKQKMKVGTRHFNKSFYSKLANRIVQKPVSFYKFGLKEQEKTTCKAVFKELFGIDKQNLKGTLSVGQLWDNKSMVKYLKENQMFFNKDILIKQFRSIDKEQKLKKRNIQLQKQREFVNKYREMLRENRRLNEKNLNYKQMKEMDAKEACSFIRSEIDRLSSSNNKYRIKTNSRKIMAGLESSYDNFHKIADKFKNKMIVLL